MGELDTWKAMALVSNIVIGTGGILLARSLPNNGSFRIGCAMASGVLLATALTSLLPEALEQLEEWQHESLSGYPIVLMLCGVSFLTLVLIEETVHYYGTGNTGSEKNVRVQLSTIDADESDLQSVQLDDKDAPAFCTDAVTVQVEAMKDPHGIELTETSAVFVFLGVSVHALLEGLSVGAADHVEGLVKTLIAILVHKALAAFALGSMLVEARPPLVRFVLYSALFTLATPLGIAIGWVASLTEESAGKLAPICSALAAGAFLFVCTMEFLPITFHGDKKFFGWKVLALVVGFASMATLPLWAPSHHDEE